MSDWSSDVCSSELRRLRQLIDKFDVFRRLLARQPRIANDRCDLRQIEGVASADHDECADRFRSLAARRSEEHTSELQSLMRISYAVFCLKKKNKPINILLKHTYTHNNANQNIYYTSQHQVSKQQQ